jgi:hypothetical protein
MHEKKMMENEELSIESRMIQEAAAFMKTIEDLGSNTPGNEDKHYHGTFQVIDFIEQQGVGAHEANIIKYVVRWKRKGGITDLFKAGWYLMRLIKHAKRQEAIEASQRG